MSSTNAMTPKFRVSYPKVFEAELNTLSGKKEFSVVALFKKGEDITALKKAAHAAAVKKWGPDQLEWPENMKSPFRDQGERAKKIEGKKIMPPGYEAGAVFLNLKSAQKPGLVNQKVEDIIDETEFYAGCYARATINAYAYDIKGNKGIAFGLGNLQKVSEGEPFGSRTKAADDFEALEGAEEEAMDLEEAPKARPVSSRSANSMFD